MSNQDVVELLKAGRVYVKGLLFYHSEVTCVAVSTVTGRVEVEELLAAVRPNTCLISVMLANNETGVIMVGLRGSVHVYTSTLVYPPGHVWTPTPRWYFQKRDFLSLQPIRELCRKVNVVNEQRGRPRILLHTDAAQALGKIPVDVADLGVDYLTIVGHKVDTPP